MPDNLRSRLLAEAASFVWCMHQASLQTLFAALALRAGVTDNLDAARPTPSAEADPSEFMAGLAAMEAPLALAAEGDAYTAAIRAAVAEAQATGQPYAKIHGNAEAALARKAGAVAVIPCIGVVATRLSWIEELFGVRSANPLRIAAAAQAAAADPDVKAIIFAVDTPGGNSTNVPEAAEAILSVRGKKPMIAQVIGMCASAGYWLMSAADEIVAQPSAMVGSIGAYLYHEDWSEAYAKAGVKPSYIKRGAFKAEFNPEIPMTEEARAHVQELVDDTYDLFTTFVAKARGVPLATVQGEAYGEGRVFMADRAKARGMVDKVRTMSETLKAIGGTDLTTPKGDGRGGVAYAAARLRLANARTAESAI
jgi:signal peptide peptidase SppA